MFMKYSIVTRIYTEILINQAVDNFTSSRFRESRLYCVGTDAYGVYAAGDVVMGTKFVIAVIAAGRKAAEEMDQYLGGNGDISEKLLDEEYNVRSG